MNIHIVVVWTTSDPKIMVVIMDGCGRIRVSFREFQVLGKLVGDIITFGTGRSFGYGHVHGRER